MDILEQIKNYSIEGYDWKMSLSLTKQDEQYHAEGDVFTHTMLVVESLLNDNDYNALDKQEQKLVLLAAILHDIAKPFCTKIEDGRIISPNHARKGEIEARKLIYKYGFMSELFGVLSPYEREQVCAMVRYHGLPLLFLDKGNMEKMVFKASLETKSQYLYMLAKADINGRFCDANEENLSTIELYKQYCIENECFTNPKQFKSNSGRFLYFTRSSFYLNYSPYEKDNFKVYMMCGIPAAGKDTYISNNFTDLNIVSLDEIRDEMKISAWKNQGTVVQEAKARAKKLLAKKQSFVWNSTNVSEKIRAPLINLFSDYNAKVELIYIETPVKELLKRNSLRIKPVPENVINKLIDNLEVPKIWESHIVCYRY